MTVGAKNTTTLWRPVGRKELNLIEESGWKSFPPRLPDQPIFYPVLNFQYAEQIARDWNSVREEGDFEGYVTEFEVAADFLGRYEPQNAGADGSHDELWVPAEELDEFNDAIVGRVTVVAKYVKKKRVPHE